MNSRRPTKRSRLPTVSPRAFATSYHVKSHAPATKPIPERPPLIAVILRLQHASSTFLPVDPRNASAGAVVPQLISYDQACVAIRLEPQQCSDFQGRQQL